MTRANDRLCFVAPSCFRVKISSYVVAKEKDLGSNSTDNTGTATSSPLLCSFIVAVAIATLDRHWFTLKHSIPPIITSYYKLVCVPAEPSFSHFSFEIFKE